MKRRILALLFVVVMLVTLPTYADAASCLICIVPDITFDGTEAACTASITGDRLTDSISATMTLKRGTKVIDEWSGSGSGILIVTGTTNVSHRTTYTLTVNATINGIAQTTVTISRTNS